MGVLVQRRARPIESYFSVQSPSLTEGDSGNKNFGFLLISSRTFPFDVRISYETVQRGGGDAAQAGVDYVSTSGTATLVSGQTQVTVNVPVIGDTTAEADELFDLRFYNFREA